MEEKNPAVRAQGGEPAADGASHPHQYYIVAASAAADEQNRVLKQGDAFAVFDHFGDIKPAGLGEEGFFHGDTRFLSCLVFNLGSERPLFLSSTVKQDNDLMTVDLTNPDITRDGQVVVPRGALHVSRTKFLWGGASYERLRVKSYEPTPIEVVLVLHFAADFADIFEVRGTRRPARGRVLPPRAERAAVALSYEGLDGALRQTRLTFTPPPTTLTGAEARHRLTLPPRGHAVFDLVVSCEGPGIVSRPLPFDEALAETAADLRAARDQACLLRAGNERFNDWVLRAEADLHMMTTLTAEGPYPYAGVPWFSTTFGRDGIITALECLAFDPAPARGVLGFLAATQATAVVPEQDAQPGKVLHEARSGEMAALKEVPFGRYYGSIDATPLFVLLAGAYVDRTADRPFLESIWPNLEAALGWIDLYGDLDGDGFVEYARSTPKGLVNQGWKDSHDAVFHEDGRLADGPIALCEVQGYVFAAKRAAADLARRLGLRKRAEELEREALRLKDRFEQTFWCEDLGTYALALDGAKRPCRVRSSNAGHCLFTGIADPERARRTGATLLGPESFSGWGVRTIAASESRYNPMAYHNGSVWPHDNALIAAGLSRYGMHDLALKILTGLFEASQFLDLHRMPELFCGFPRRAGEGPTLYPVACAPQAWSAAAVFFIVQSCLGLTVGAEPPRVGFSYSRLPPFLRELRIHKLRAGPAAVDLLLRRHRTDVDVNVLRREGEVEVRMVK